MMITGREAWKRVREIADSMPFNERSRFLSEARDYVMARFEPRAIEEYRQAMYDAGYHK